MNQYKFWFVVGSQFLYGPEVLEIVAARAAEIAADPELLAGCFGGELEFGTAGLRGILDAGTARMNRLTVGKATQGLARVLLEEYRSGKLGNFTLETPQEV